MPPPAHLGQAGDLNGTWNRRDDGDIQQEARDVMERCRQGRAMDEAMTPGVIRRQTITPQRPRVELPGW